MIGQHTEAEHNKKIGIRVASHSLAEFGLYYLNGFLLYVYLGFNCKWNAIMGNFFGDNGANLFTGVDQFNFYASGDGNDRITAGNGFDITFAGAGNDRLISGGGQNFFFGGTGRDVFESSGVAGYTAIFDWEDGADLLDVSNLGVESFSELVIFEGASSLFINAAGAWYELKNVTESEISAADFLFSQPGEPTLLTFEDIDPFSGAFEVSDGHGGFNWDNFFTLNTALSAVTVGPNGFSANSGTVAVVNGNAEPATISNNTNFDLESVYMSSGWNSDLQVTVEGYDDGILIGSQTFELSYAFSKKFDLDDAIFDSVDEVVFTSFGGTDFTSIDGGTGTHFALDDVLIFI